MTTINPANFAFKDADSDVGIVKSLTAADITLIDNALQDIEDLKLSIQSPAPVGSVMLLDTDIIPDGWLLCNGAAVSRSTYSALFDKLGTRHGAGDGSTTFNLPDMRDRYPIGVGTNTIGTAIAEQLPNIIGAIGTVINQPLTSGMIYAGSAHGYVAGSASGWGIVEVYANASRSNSIYIDNGHVYPASIALNFIIKT